MKAKPARTTKYGRAPVGVAATPLYRALTRHYLSKPDPAAWLALADLFEEAGDGANAALWRRRGEWFEPLRHARALCSADFAQYVQFDLWRHQFTHHVGPPHRPLAWPYVELISARLPPPPYASRCFHLADASASRTYWTRRVLGVIDWCSAVEANLARREAEGGPARQD